MNALLRPQGNLFDIEIEQALLGMCIVESALITDCPISADDFYDPLHQRLWRAIAEEVNRGSRASPFAIAAKLSADEGLKEVGGRNYLVNLARAAPILTVAGAGELCRIVRDWKIKRDLICQSERLIGEVSIGRTGAELLAEQISALQELSEGRAEANEPANWYEAGARALTAMETVKRGGKPNLIRLGIPALDAEIGGVGPGELIILAGRPGMGKTAVGLLIAHAVASPPAQSGFDLDASSESQTALGVYFASLEMRDEQLLQRGLSMVVRNKGRRIPYTLIRNAKVDDNQHQALVDALMTTQALPIVIDERGGMTVGQIATNARRTAARMRKAGQKLGLVIVDHLHLIESDQSHSRDNETTKLTAITKALKQLAKALKVPVVCLSQLSRETERRDDKRPFLSDLRQSGSIEQDADMVIFAHRPEYYLKKSAPDETSDLKTRGKWEAQMEREKDKLHLIVAKHRQGPECEVTVKCDMACNWIDAA